MVMYLIECTIPETGEVRFIGKDNSYIEAGEPHRFVSKFAMDHGFSSFYVANFEAAKLSGNPNTVIRAEVYCSTVIINRM